MVRRDTYIYGPARAWGAAALFLAILAGPAVPARAQDAPDGSAVFQKNCALCHGVDPRAPTLDMLHQHTPESVLHALIGGVMSRQGTHLSDPERRAVSEFVTGQKFSEATIDPNIGRCTKPIGKYDPKKPSWAGWSNTIDNWRYAPKGGVTAADLPNLKLKWAFGFPDADTVWSQPTVESGRVYVGSQTGFVYALDQKTGCTYWSFPAKGGVRSSVLIGPRKAGNGFKAGYNAYFTDMSGYLHAVDANSGKEVWGFHIEMHPESRMTGPPALYRDRLYVPSASFEEVTSADPKYECCTFRGSLTAVDTQTGKVVWRFYPISKEPVEIGANTAGTKRFGPSGGGIWGAPAIDAKHGRIFVGVGNTYSGEDQPLTDSVVAIDMKTGTALWSFKQPDTDVFVAGARLIPNFTNGPDYDFGAAVVYGRMPNGKDAVFAGSKSGTGYALDANTGQKLWEYHAGLGGTNGGMEWGTSYDGKTVYFPVNDVNRAIPGGLHAVDALTGNRVWFAPPPRPLCAPESATLLTAETAAAAPPPPPAGRRGGETDDAGAAGAPGRGGRGGAPTVFPNRNCNAAQSAAITIIPGAVLSGALDGGMRAYSTKDGSILWTYDANKTYQTVNGVPAKGSSFIGPGPVVVGGMLFLASGYGSHNGRPGNVLLAFGK